MKKKKIIYILIIFLLLYLPFAPVFLKSEYGSQPHANLSVGKAFSYLWVQRNDTFLFLFVCGLWKYKIQKRTNLMFRDEQGGLSKVIIKKAGLIIDGQDYQLSDLDMKVIDMDFSFNNMYAGAGSSGIVPFTLPVTPKKEIRIRIEGELIDINGINVLITQTVTSDIITESRVIPFYKFLDWYFGGA